MKTKRKIEKLNLNDPDLDIPPLTDEQLRSMRRATLEETEHYRKALENTFHRPFPPSELHAALLNPPTRSTVLVYMKLHPRALAWARKEAKRPPCGLSNYHQ